MYFRLTVFKGPQVKSTVKFSQFILRIKWQLMESLLSFKTPFKTPAAVSYPPLLFPRSSIYAKIVTESSSRIFFPRKQFYLSITGKKRILLTVLSSINLRWLF